MKKWFFVILVIVAVAFFALGAFAAAPIRLIVNGTEVRSDVPPQIINGRVMVPIRFVGEALEANVSWDQNTNSVIVTTNPLPTQDQTLGLEVIESLMTTDKYDNKAIIGKLKNNSNRRYNDVFIYINLYDTSNNQLGFTTAVTTNLEPGITWNFQADFFEENVSKYKIIKIEAY